jgi:hypothetical protein
LSYGEDLAQAGKSIMLQIKLAGVSLKQPRNGAKGVQLGESRAFRPPGLVSGTHHL